MLAKQKCLKKGNVGKKKYLKTFKWRNRNIKINK